MVSGTSMTSAGTTGRPLLSPNGREPETNAALATAWVAVGPVINKNMPINNSFTVIKVKPACSIMPKSSNPVPAESTTAAACNLDQKSGNRMMPAAPTIKNCRFNVNW